MAIPLASQPVIETPEKVVVANYGVHRLNTHPSMWCDLMECVSLKDKNGVPVTGVFGATAYRHTQVGRVWRITLDSNKPEAFERMVAAQTNIAKRIAAGADPDTANAQECEALETERRAGTLTYATIEGNAP